MHEHTCNLKGLYGNKYARSRTQGFIVGLHRRAYVTTYAQSVAVWQIRNSEYLALLLLDREESIPIQFHPIQSNSIRSAYISELTGLIITQSGTISVAACQAFDRFY